MSRNPRARSSPWFQVGCAVLLLPALLLVLAGGYTIWALLPHGPHPPEDFLRHRGELTGTQVLERSVSGGVVTEEVLLASSTGLRVRGLIRYPDDLTGPSPAFLLLGGIRSGRRALEGLSVEEFPIVWMAIDYVYEPPPSFPGPGSILRELGRAEEGAQKTVAGLWLGLDYLESMPEVDLARTGLGGGSLGAYFAVVAGALDPRFEAVAVLYGGSPLHRVTERNLKLSSPLARKAMSLFLKPWLDRVDPVHFAGRIAPRPLLMVNGRDDTRIPKDCVETLFAAAKEPKEIYWVDTPHRVQGQPELVAKVAEVAVRWLREQGWLDRPHSRQ